MEFSELPRRFTEALQALGIAASQNAPLERNAFASVIQTWNNTLKLKNKAQFVSDSITGVPIPPVPYTVMGWPVRIVVWGLNPKYIDWVEYEKQAALAPPGTWDSYAQFHVGDGNTKCWPRVLPWAIRGAYYYNLGTIAATLQSQQFHTLREYYTSRKPDHALEAFWQLTKTFGVMAAEFLPFHSEQTSLPMVRNFLGPNHPQTTLEGQLDAYHQVLLDTTMNVLGTDGWIIALGNSVSQALKALLTAHGTLKLSSCTINGNVIQSVEVGTWTPTNSSGRYKVSFSPFIRAKNSPINSNANIAAWLSQIW